MTTVFYIEGKSNFEFISNEILRKISRINSIGGLNIYFEENGVIVEYDEPTSKNGYKYLKNLFRFIKSVINSYS
jgi:hypothetical protein